MSVCRLCIESNSWDTQDSKMGLCWCSHSNSWSYTVLGEQVVKYGPLLDSGMLFGLRTFIFYDYFLLFSENNLNFSCSERQLCLLYTAEMFSAKYCSNLPISSIFPEYPKKKNLPLPALLVFLFQEDHKGKSGRECKQHHRESDGHQQDDVPAGAAE